MNIDTSLFGPVLKAWMDFRQLGQQSLTRKSGLDQQTISAILGGHQQSIRQGRLEMLARGLDLPVQVLMLGLQPQDLFDVNDAQNSLAFAPNGNRKLIDMPGGFDILLALYFCRRFNNGFGFNFQIKLDHDYPYPEGYQYPEDDPHPE